MKTYNVFAKKMDNCEEKEDNIQLNTSPINEEELARSVMFYLIRGEWNDRGYFLEEVEIK